RAQSAGLAGLEAEGFALVRLDAAQARLRGELGPQAANLPGLRRPVVRLDPTLRTYLSPELEARIRSVYRADQELHDRAEADPSPPPED
ncbi:MAG: hypothetical protein AAFQ51_18360, partial [Pseudomonadota bacterium]